MQDPARGRILVVARTADGKIYSAWETGQGTQVWGTWTTVDDGQSYPTDPTVFTFQNSNGTSVAFVTRNVNSQVVLYAAQDPATLARTSAGTPAFTPVEIPQPPRR